MTDPHPAIDTCRQLLLEGRAEATRQLAEDTLAAHPAELGLRHLHAVACLSLGDWAAAESGLRAVLATEPGNAQAWDHLGVALHHSRRHDVASDAFGQSLRLAAGVATTWANAASNAFDDGRHAEALRCARRALALDPRLAPAALAQGNALLALGRAREAAHVLETACALPGAGPAERSSLAMAWCECGRGSDALRLLEEVLSQWPQAIDARVNLAVACYRAGRVDAALEHYRIALDHDPDNAALWSAWLFALSHSDRHSPEAVCAAHLRYGEHFNRVGAASRRHDHLLRDPQRRLRVGFVSGDLRDHPVARFIAPVWQVLRAAGFEVFAYHSAAVEDAVSRRLRGLTDGWRTVHTLDDEALDRRIVSDAIDMLFDLSGHTAGNRLPLFARRPAPVQLSWMGYPGTTGLRAIDYRLTGCDVAEDGQAQARFVERLVGLDYRNRFQPLDDLPPVAPLPARKRGHLTFGSFARPSKLTAASVALWAAVLQRAPDTRMLVVGAAEGAERERIAQGFMEHGVSPGRVDFRARMPLADYLAAHAEVDLLLDSVPYSGGTTVNYGLWMGVPTLTLAPAGAPLSQSHGAGKLHGAGLSEWVAGSEAEFVERAAVAAADVAPLEAVRLGLRARMQQLDRLRAQEDELPQVLRGLWQRWCANGQPG